jgi:hypothetical protein
VFLPDQSSFAEVPSYVHALLETQSFAAYLHRVLIIGPNAVPQNYLTVLRVHPVDDLQRWQPLGVVRSDSLILERDVVSVTDLTSEIALKSKLCSWASAGRPEAVASDLSFFMERVPGRRAFGAAPCWRFAGIGSRGQIVNVPIGPFFDHATKLFLPDLPTAARRWTGSSKHNAPQVVDNSYQVIIPDYRAYFADVVVTDNGLLVNITRRTEDRLSVVVSGIDLDGQPSEQILEVAPQQASDTIVVDVDFVAPLASFKLFLVGESGMLYDEHSEPQYNALPGDSLLAPERGPRAQGVHDLARARNRGEGLDIEFKEWIPRDRGNRKSPELLHTAVAFANARGGTIYIGVLVMRPISLASSTRCVGNTQGTLAGASIDYKRSMSGTCANGY